MKPSFILRHSSLVLPALCIMHRALCISFPTFCILHSTFCIAGSSASPAPAAEADDPIDLKPWALECYGLRGAVAVDKDTVVAVFGASSTFSRSATNAWRVLSEDDPAYAYDKFVKPVAAEDLADPVEFEQPEGFDAPKPATNELQRFVVKLSLLTPLKAGKRYGLVVLGDERTVTGGKTGCYFTWDGSVVAKPESVRVPADDRAARMIGLRRVSPLGMGILALEFGASFSRAEWLDPAQYAVRFNGEAVPVREFGRRSKIDVYVPEGWPFHTFLEHDVYLDVGRDPKPGERVEVTVSPKICSGVRKASFVFSPDATITRSIKANQTGYLPDGPKRAYLGFWLGSYPELEKASSPGFDCSTVPDAKAAFAKSAPPPPSNGWEHLAAHALRFREEPTFELVREGDRAVVFSGVAKLTHNGRRSDGKMNHSGENVYSIDFTDFAEPGRYYLRVPGVGRSLSFDIAADVYVRPFLVQSAGVFAQRCGFELTPDHAPGWRRIACHTNGVVATTVETWRKGGGMGPLLENPDPAVPDPIPLRGGHHDAGDYNPRSHIDVAQVLLDAWDYAPSKFHDGQLDIPEAGNGIPDIVDEALWALEPWLALQDKDGGVRHGTESNGDPGFAQTVELDQTGDFAYAKDCQASFAAAGAFAQASRALAACGKAERAAMFLDRARRAYEWGVANVPTTLKDKFQCVQFRFAARALAAAELLHTTGEATYLDDFRACVPWVEYPKADTDDWGRYDVFDAACAFLRDRQNETRDPDLFASVCKAVVAKANSYIRGSDNMAYKFIRHPSAPISWGTGCYGNHIKPVIAAWFATGDSKYRDWTILTCDNMLGANPLGLSWIVGTGQRSIHSPLHNSRYRPEGVVADGMQSEGPNGAGGGYNYTATVYPKHRDGFAPLYAFVDAYFAIVMDEGMVSHQVIDMAMLGLLLPDHE